MGNLRVTPDPDRTSPAFGAPKVDPGILLIINTQLTDFHARKFINSLASVEKDLIGVMQIDV